MNPGVTSVSDTPPGLPFADTLTSQGLAPLATVLRPFGTIQPLNIYKIPISRPIMQASYSVRREERLLH